MPNSIGHSRRSKRVSKVVPNWAKRCGDQCTKDWLDTAGKVVGIDKIGN